jgi:AraC-like DNA-binding protein
MDLCSSQEFLLEHFLRLDTSDPEIWLSALQDRTHLPIISQKFVVPLANTIFRARLSFVSSHSLNAVGIYLNKSSIISGVNMSSTAIIMPIAGRIDFETGSSRYVCDPWKPFVLDPHEDFRATLSGETHIFAIQLNALTGRGYRYFFEQCQAQLLDALYLFLGGTPFFKNYQHAQKQLENLNRVLLELIGPGRLPSAEPRKKISDDRRICKAIALINEELLLEIDIESIAKRSGLSLRNLHYLMHDHIGQSPYQYVRGRRLIKARQAIIQGYSEKTTIAQQAMKWGFLHTGRFSKYYYAAFGEYPKDTLSVLARLEKNRRNVKVLRDQADNAESRWLVCNTGPTCNAID